MKKSLRLKVRVDWAQQKMLERLRKELAEQGYAIFPIAKNHRRHRLDFIAVLKEPPLNFLVVRPTAKGRLSVTPFGPRSQYRQADKAITHARRAIDINVSWSPRQLTEPPTGTGWWEEYLPQSVREEVRILLGLG